MSNGPGKRIKRFSESVFISGVVMDPELETLKKSLATVIDQNKALVARIEKGIGAPNYPTVPASPIDHKEEGRYGYQSFGQYLQTVKNAPRDPAVWAKVNEQIGKGLERSITKGLAGGIQKSPSGNNESVDSDGHFLVPPTFSTAIFERIYHNDELINRCDKYTCTGNQMVFPAVDETSRVDGSRYGGVQAYWFDEAQQGTTTKPKFRRLTLTLKKLMALGFVTQELQDDAMVAMDAFLTRMFGLEIAFKVGDAIVNGTGVTMPRGILNSPSLISVAKDGGQAAKTITALNIWNMWQRMWGPCRKNAVWLYNQDCEAQFYGMKLDVGTGGLPIYLPPGGISAAPFATLMGRPMIPVEFCQTLGTVGDLILWDPSAYCVLSKGTPETAMSMHLRFDYDESAYRTIFRVDGDCWWSTALTPKNGSNTLSTIVALSTRA